MIGKRRSEFINTYVEEKIEALKKVDIDMFSETFQQDSYRDALLNTTKLFLLSRKFDRVRNVNWGGFFDGLLRAYPMNEEGSRRIEEELMEEIFEKIPDVYITSIKAVPDVENKLWDVTVKSMDKETNISTEFLDDENVKVSISQKIEHEL